MTSEVNNNQVLSLGRETPRYLPLASRYFKSCYFHPRFQGQKGLFTSLCYEKTIHMNKKYFFLKRCYFNLKQSGYF